jgi:hypothetical protein
LGDAVELLGEFDAVRSELFVKEAFLAAARRERGLTEEKCDALRAVLVAASRLIANYPWPMAPELQELQSAISKVHP